MKTGTDLRRPEIHRGLIGVHFDRTAISMVDGKKGTLSFRGHFVDALVAHSTFEETAYLLIHGCLPTSSELREFAARLKAARMLPQPVIDLIAAMKHAHPMDALRTAVSALVAFDRDGADNSIEAVRRKSARLLSQMAISVATHHALRHGREPSPPDDTLAHAANFLWMLKGTVPTPEEAKVLDEDFILHAEHSCNASSFAARVIVSAQSGYHGAIAGALACFEGMLHGGAIDGVAAMVEEIGSPERVPDYVRERRRRRERIVGFGSRIYKTTDPRAHHLRRHVEILSRSKGEPHHLQILNALAEEMKAYAKHGVHMNDDFYGSISYKLLGISADLCAAVFSLCRLAGWTAQIIEQYSNNILIRPMLEYIGSEGVSYVPIDERDGVAIAGASVAPRADLLGDARRSPAAWASAAEAPHR
jgi:citrate synthase